MSRNDEAWEKLFARHAIIETVKRDGFCEISADSIRVLREPRLMTKFDHRVNLPRIFADNGLAVLPLSRSGYVIAAFSAYAEIPREASAMPVQIVRPPAYLQSLSSSYVTSEAVALHYAGACGIWEDFLEEEGLTPTVSGRMGSGKFEFRINTTGGECRLDVCNAQLEIDAAWEGRGSLALIEAKMDLSEDFHIRQLYYPFRLWRNRVTKPVRSIFFNYSDGIFTLYEYSFADPFHYNSLNLIRKKRYVVATDISRRDLEHLLQAAIPEEEPAEPFPQADDFTRVINLLELLNVQPMSAEDIAARYSFTARQAAYYSAAGRYLGLMAQERTGAAVRHILSGQGRRLMTLPLRERRLALAAAILKHSVFRETLRLALAGNGTAELPSRNEIVHIMREASPCGVEGESTFFRRASTVRGWIRWILVLCE